MKRFDRHILDALANDNLHLILMPTEGCNFRCTYCYEDFRLGRMQPEVVRGVKNLLARRAGGLRSLFIAWFGGEPLLAFDLIDEIQETAQALAREHPGLRLEGDITTNAWLLTRDRFRRLVGLGVTRYQISFDGPRAWHDRKRVLAGGGGTFDRVWGNLLALRDEPGDWRVTVRLHADRDNLEALPQFLEEYGPAFGDDPRFTLFIRPLSRFGGPNDAALNVLSPDEEHRAIGLLRRLSAGRGLGTEEPCAEESICYAARGNSFLVRADGRINKCTLALEHPANQVGRLNEDGTMALEARAVRPWMRGLASLAPRELVCPMEGLADPAALSAAAASASP